MIDINDFKAGMRRFAAGVSLITTCGADGQRAGLTATAVCSVSAEPPTLLVCVNRKNGSYATLCESGIFGVNVLAFDDRALADRFASPISAEEKFNEGLWTKLNTGAPILESALVGFDCRLVQTVSVGTHDILFGEIQAIKVRPAEVKPLLFAHGGYGGFASNQSAQMADLMWMPSWQSQADGW
jgi:flavin reductase (NADH)/flavin reductase